MQIKYTITFLSDWHAGSGLSAGAEADAVVIKDKNNLPYLPGKTIKGLLKDALYDIIEVQPSLIDIAKVDQYFGKENENTKGSIAGTLFFSNAQLPKNEAEEITKELSDFLYHNLASTTIDDNGVAKAGSLRTMEVCVPLTLEAEIEGVEKEDVAIFETAFKYLRHLGVNRNRGLGRCKFKLIATN
jgi:CRISPR/Cas system CSM-associated protein Csm3 (group 7 of RAMP superfamily)